MVIVDYGLVLFVGLLLVLMIGGAVLNFTEWFAKVNDWLTNNTETIIIICVVFTLFIMVSAYFIFSKKIYPALSTLLYSSQLLFMSFFGLYQLSILANTSRIKCIILVFIYAVYVFLNFVFEWLVIFELDDFTLRDAKNKGGFAAFCIGGLGIIGWIINFIVLF